MLDLDTRAPPLLGQFETEPAAHLSPRRSPSEREAGDVERQVETDDRRPELVAATEEHVLDE
jgi:hypothetical protein